MVGTKPANAKEIAIGIQAVNNQKRSGVSHCLCVLVFTCLSFFPVRIGVATAGAPSVTADFAFPIR